MLCEVVCEGRRAASEDISTRLARGLLCGGDSVRGRDNERLAHMAWVSGKAFFIL
jgi:hypothetical protein